MIKEQYYKRKIGNKYEKVFHKRMYEMSNKNMKKYSTLLVTMGILLKSLWYTVKHPSKCLRLNTL